MVYQVSDWTQDLEKQVAECLSQSCPVLPHTVHRSVARWGCGVKPQGDHYGQFAAVSVPVSWG